MARLTNRVQKLENALPSRTGGIIVYMDNVVNTTVIDEDGNKKEVMQSGDFYLHNEDAEKMTLNEMYEHLEANGYTYITFLPVSNKVEDVQFVELHNKT